MTRAIQASALITILAAAVAASPGVDTTAELIAYMALCLAAVAAVAGDA